MNRYFSLAQTGKTAEIYIFGDITSWEWLESDVSSYTLAKTIGALPPDVDQIDVHINSYGGEVAEGLAIYNALRNHSAKVRTVCDGFACSIASVIFMAGDERAINPASLLMIHNAWTLAEGNADELRKAADDLDVITSASKAAYLARVNITADELDELMNNETWITPDEAVRMGFATEIAAESTNGKASQSVRRRMYERLTTAEAKPANIPAAEVEETNTPLEPEIPAESKTEAPRQGMTRCNFFEILGGIKHHDLC